MMKRLFALLMVLALSALLLSGCTPAPAEDPHPEWPPEILRLGYHLGAQAPEGFEAAEMEDTPSYTGVYYYTFTRGEGLPIKTSMGGDALIYEAQIYILLLSNKSEAQAAGRIDEWVQKETDYFQTSELGSRTYVGSEFRILSLTATGENEPYPYGRAAFAALGADAVSIEFLCSDRFEGDADAVFEEFLSGLIYAE